MSQYVMEDIMKNKRWSAAICAAVGLVLATAFCASASEIRIINEESESEETAAVISQGQVQGGAMTGDETEQEPETSRPLNPSAEKITADDAVSGARTLYEFRGTF